MYTEQEEKLLLQQLKQLVDRKPNSCQSSLIRNKKLLHLKEFLFDKTVFLENFFSETNEKLTISTRLWYLTNGKVDILRCQNVKCNKPLVKNISCVGNYVPKYCNDKCSQTDPILQKQTRITRKRLYGSETYNNSKKAKETRAKRNNGEYFSNESRKNISLHCSFRKDETREKGLKKKKMLYGNPNFNNREKAKQTYRKFTGYDNPSQNPIVKKQKQTTSLLNYGVKCYWISDESKAKSEQVCIEKYNAKSWIYSDDCKKKLHDETYIKCCKEKEYATKKKNRSFSSSKPEKEAYWMLKFIFPKLQTQHKSEAYPFVADFYDPSQPNVRFEFQGSWTHGRHPFNPSSEEDQNELKRMQEKGSEYYRVAIDVWTRRDPMKREVAKKNGIQLIEFWNLEEVRSFVVNYFRSK